jgi:hypothetical protein
MNPALLLMGVYLLVTLVLQGSFILVSRFIDQFSEEWSLLVFLVLFMAAFALAWPIAVRITEPKTVEGALQNDLLTLQKQGLIRRFSVEHRKDGPFVQVSPGMNSPPDLRPVLVLALGGAVAENRISISA